MQETLNKQNPLSLPQQLALILQERIRNGQYAPGKKMDSVRKLSDEFHISSQTVQRTLKQLESDGFTISVPGSGVFINDRFEQEQSPVKIAFVFPEEEISPRLLTPENWAICSEIHRGLLSGGRTYGAHIDFIYIDEKLEELQMFRQIKRLSQYHSLLFTGEQLLDLQLKMSGQLPVFHFPSKIQTIPHLITVDYNREDGLKKMARHAQASGCRTAGVLALRHPPHESSRDRTSYDDNRGSHFLQFCQELGLETRPEHQIYLNSPGRLREQILPRLAADHPDFLFCTYTDGITDLYEVCSLLNLQIGTDLKIAGMGTGYTFQGLIPSLTYLRIPMFRLAEETVRDTCRIVNEKIPPDQLQRETIYSEFIIGKSTDSSIQEKKP